MPDGAGEGPGMLAACGRTGSGFSANDLATSAATWGCMARIGDRTVTGSSDLGVWRVGTLNRSSTGCERGAAGTRVAATVFAGAGTEA